VVSLRDILQRHGKPERDEETVRLVRAHFDRVLVHGDPTFARLGDSFPLADRIADRVSYTGLVCAPPMAVPQDRFDIVVSAGGGAVGGALVQAALEAAALLPGLGTWGVITGPNLPQGDFDRLAVAAPPGARLMRFRTDFPGLLAGARLSVSQAGYNTVGDVLVAGCRALLIPYSEGGETEQGDRASRLAAIGRASVLEERDLSGAAMAAAVARALAQPVSPDAPKIMTDGAFRTAEILTVL
jgi:predicted glycosyltransferase